MLIPRTRKRRENEATWLFDMLKINLRSRAHQAIYPS
jgi:hypothetical protein